jgi:hypothetical protein
MPENSLPPVSDTVFANSRKQAKFQMRRNSSEKHFSQCDSESTGVRKIKQIYQISYAPRQETHRTQTVPSASFSVGRADDRFRLNLVFI